VVSILTETGRKTLNNNQFKLTSYNQVEEEEFDEKDFEKILKKYFNMEVEETKSKN